MKITRIENDSLFVEYGNDFIIYYDGSNYKGEIKEIENSDNIRHGYGVMIYSNDKSSYIGCYKDNVKHDNGYIYEGEFVNGLRCGKGKFISHNGYIVYDGEWQYDVPISSIEIEKSRNIEKYISKKVSQYINNYFENKCDQAYYNMFPPDEKYYFY
jgi:hypothetical protein